MTNGMEIVAQAWENREGPAVLATVDAAKTPNVIYVGEIRYLPNEDFIVADNYFCKTRANIKRGTKGAILFLTKEHKSFQVKGPLTYHTQGPIFENMRSWHDPKHPGVAASVLGGGRRARSGDETERGREVPGRPGGPRAGAVQPAQRTDVLSSRRAGFTSGRTRLPGQAMPKSTSPIVAMKSDQPTTPDSGITGSTVVFQPIGIIRTPHQLAEHTPVQPIYALGCPGQAEILPPYREGLRDLEGFSP